MIALKPKTNNFKGMLNSIKNKNKIVNNASAAQQQQSDVDQRSEQQAVNFEQSNISVPQVAEAEELLTEEQMMLNEVVNDYIHEMMARVELNTNKSIEEV